MAVQIVYDGAAGGGQLFAGKKFFFTQKVPMRKRWIELFENNGGEVVKLEKDADLIIVDPVRKSLPAGSIAWTYIEKSVQKGQLENLADHPGGAAAGTLRMPGSSAVPKKGIRTAYTPEDDKILLNWVRDAAQRGDNLKGNLLYKDLADQHRRHTMQSWRDRWVKTLSLRHPEINENYAEESSPSVEEAGVQVVPATQSSPGNRSRIPASQNSNSAPPAFQAPQNQAAFSAKEVEEMEASYDNILNMPKEELDAAWINLAEDDDGPSRTAEQWAALWYEDVYPRITRMREEAARGKATSQGNHIQEADPENQPAASLSSRTASQPVGSATPKNISNGSSQRVSGSEPTKGKNPTVVSPVRHTQSEALNDQDRDNTLPPRSQTGTQPSLSQPTPRKYRGSPGVPVEYVFGRWDRALDDSNIMRENLALVLAEGRLILIKDNEDISKGYQSLAVKCDEVQKAVFFLQKREVVLHRRIDSSNSVAPCKVQIGLSDQAGIKQLIKLIRRHNDHLELKADDGPDAQKMLRHLELAFSQESQTLSQEPATKNAGSILGDEHSGLPRIDTESDFREFINKEYDNPPDYRPKINGQKISLFELWSVVNNEFGGYKTVRTAGKWPAVAERLKFNPSQLRDTPSQLLNQYEQYLLKLDIFLGRDTLENHGMEEEMDVESEGVDVDNYEDDENDSDDFITQPNLDGPRKRTYETINDSEDELTAATSEFMGNKRRKVDKGKAPVLEIPSTPPEVPDSYSPSGHGNEIRLDWSPPHGLTSDDPEFESAHETFSPAKRTSSDPISQKLPAKRYEPETQDFYYSQANGAPREPSPEIPYSSPVSRKSASANKGVSAATDPVRSTPQAQKGAEVDVPAAADAAIDAIDDDETQSQSDSQRNAELQAAVDYWVQLGYASDIVAKAFEATSMHTGNVGEVMESLTQGKGIPDTLPGVWTEEDDLTLQRLARTGWKEFDDTKELMDKHGEEVVHERIAFLRDLDRVHRGEV